MTVLDVFALIVLIVLVGSYHNGFLAAVGFHMGLRETEGAPAPRQGCA